MLHRNGNFTLKVQAGGQTGVDRAGLDAAMAAGFPTNGWFPLGRWAEDGEIPSCYRGKEVPSRLPEVRTVFNVATSDGSIILTTGEPKDGTPFTKECALLLGKSLLEIDLDHPISPEQVVSWIRANSIRTLNVAGPRESHRPGFVYSTALAYLTEVFSLLRQNVAEADLNR